MCVLPSCCKHKAKNQIKEKKKKEETAFPQDAAPDLCKDVAVRVDCFVPRSSLRLPKNRPLYLFTLFLTFFPPFFSSVQTSSPNVYFQTAIFVVRGSFFPFFLLLFREHSGGTFVHVLSTKARLRESALILASPGGRKRLAGRKSSRSRNLIDVLEKCRRLRILLKRWEEKEVQVCSLCVCVSE